MPKYIDAISIHASLAGGDSCATFPTSEATFQSTPPSREATVYLPSGEIDFLPAFQSTPPSREATPESARWSRYDTISIHASLAGGDIGRWTR